MVDFVPKRVFFEEKALAYPLGKSLHSTFQKMGIEILSTSSHNRVTGIPGKTPVEAYREGKKTLVVGVRGETEFQTCKPSAHYQLPLVTGCSGMCTYCYLATNLGKKPYIRVYVNIEEILDRAQQYIQKRCPEITLFEGAAVSDPIPVERYTGALEKTIRFFSQEAFGRFRFVTKFTDVDSLLKLDHQQHTTIRFSLNSQRMIEKYEQGTPSVVQRIAAARKVFQAGYPLGFLIAPIIYGDGWQAEYEQVLLELAAAFQDVSPEQKKEITFELISHRYTSRAKTNIAEVFPASDLDMEEQNRRYKYGQFGYGKYIYKPVIMDELKGSLETLLHSHFPGARILYFV